MGKNFGYSNIGGKDWFKLNTAYTDKEIEAIKDPEGGNETSLPTAIPSPFARIDLFKTAFRNIIKTDDLKACTKDGDVIASQSDEKLVSDCFDLAEILFNLEGVKSKIRFIKWSRKEAIEKLKSSINKDPETEEKHRRLAETLELYLEQDKKAYNFDLVDQLHLVELDHKIIGCTSPVTLFFTTANDLTHAQIKLTTNDVTFDSHYASLHERDIEFQKYIHLLFKANPILSRKMPLLKEYLEKNLKILEKLNPKLYNDLKILKADSYSQNYSELNAGTAGDIIEVFGVPFKTRKKEDIIGSINESDFMIKASKNHQEKRPLVLQNKLNKPFRYINDKWSNTIEVPYYDKEQALDKRWLPGMKVQYPWLTVSDFLEPYLIRMVYPINKEKYFDGNLVIEAGNDSKGYLLPLKKQFFDYFTTKDLIDLASNTPTIEMIQGAAGSVKVILHIPVKKDNEFISFERIYYPSNENQITKPDEEKNKGIIIEQQVGITLFPFIKTERTDIKAFYRIQLIDRNRVGIFKNTEYLLRFYTNKEKSVPLKILNEETEGSGVPRKRSSKLQADASTQYYALDQEFDFIQIKDKMNSEISGIIMPLWKPFAEGNETFSFAIDFGTTNTHIEFKKGNNPPNPFEITSDDVQIASLFHPSKTSEDFGGSGAIAIRELTDFEFLPARLGQGHRFQFPTRTVSGQGKNLNTNLSTFSLADFNIPFTYEKLHDSFNEIKTNLKWARKEQGNTKRIQAFFEKILLMLRNKVLLNNGDLSKTKLVWFFPSSMAISRKNSLEGVINDLFKMYFNPIETPIGISESLAPFYFYKSTGQISGGAYSPVVSIDIGGGTTDIVVFKANKPKLFSSFRFAANTIFGDGYSEFGATSNGIVNKYSEHFRNLLAINAQYDLLKVFDNIKEKDKSEDILAFLFSLENNQKIKDKALFSFNSLLSEDEDYKILFLYFYSAIIYNVALLMKFKLPELEFPKNIVFSGTGSKILHIISSNFKTLSRFTQFIFEDVFQKKYESEGLIIKMETKMPKEVTCKGGLMTNAEDLNLDIKSIRAIITCLENDGIDKLNYNQIDDEVKTKVLNYVQSFNTLFISLNSKMSFSDNFSVSGKSYEAFKTNLNSHLRDFLEEGWQFNNKMDDIAADNKELDETLFFYPLVGTINHLCSHLSELAPVNN